MTLSQSVRLAIIIFVVLLFPAGFVAGCMDEKARGEAFKKQVELVGEAQEERTKAKVAAYLKLKKDTDDAWKTRMADLRHANDAFTAELLASAGRGVVPAVPAAPPGSRGAEEIGPNVVCFARDLLSEGISRELSNFAGRYAGSIQEGASAIAGFKACTEWALEAGANGVQIPAK